MSKSKETDSNDGASVRAIIVAENAEKAGSNGRRGSAQSDATYHSRMAESPGNPMPNARRFLEEAFARGDRALLIHQGGQFYHWNGACWPALEDAILRSALYRFFESCFYLDAVGESKPFAPTEHKVGDLVGALRALCIMPTQTPTPSWLPASALPASLLPASEIIACSNGLVHWPARTLLPHTPDFYAHHSIGFPFDAAAPAPAQWHEFLRQLWGDDAESIATLQEIFGYLVSGDTTLQKMFLLVGPKRSGKGTIARVLSAMLGTHNVAGPTLASLGTNFGLQPLIAKPLAIISDARLGQKTDSAVVAERLLSISGEDLLTVDRKWSEPWTGQLPTRIMMLSNELPRLSDASNALASRFIVLTLANSFYGREDAGLTAKLITELPGIFLWALDGLAALRARGHFTQPAASAEAIAAMEDLGSPVSVFIREKCVIGPAFKVPRDALYGQWEVWCHDTGRTPTSREVFGRDLRAAVTGLKFEQPRVSDGQRIRKYVGIGLLNHYENAPPPSAPGVCRHCDGEGCKHCTRGTR